MIYKKKFHVKRPYRTKSGGNTLEECRSTSRWFDDFVTETHAVRICCRWMYVCVCVCPVQSEWREKGAA